MKKFFLIFIAVILSTSFLGGCILGDMSDRSTGSAGRGSHKGSKYEKQINKTEKGLKGGDILPAGDLLDFSAKYVRTDYFSDGFSPQPVITIINNKNTLDQYYEKYRRSIFDGLGNKLPDQNFLDAIENYNDNYFSNNYLVIVGLIEPSGSIRHEVKSVNAGGDILINRLQPGMGTADMAGWSLIIGLSNNNFIRQFNVSVIDVNIGY